MAAPYTSQSAPSSYNQNPPSDDGSSTAANTVKWATHKDKLGDPLKTFVESVNTQLLSAFGALIGGAGVSSKSTNYTVQSSDQGALVVATTAGITITTPVAATVGAPFVFGVVNTSSGSVTFDGNGSETVNGSASITLEAGEGAIAFTDGTNWLAVGKTAAPLPRSYMAGLGMSNNATDGSHDIDVAAGECRDSADAANIALSAITKQIDATWSAGTNAGGLSSSLTAPANSTWYHVHAIIVGGAADVGFDTSVTAANLVADHAATAYRRIGSVLTDGSANILAFVQDGSSFWWADPPLDVNNATPGTSSNTATITVPTGVRVNARLNTATGVAGQVLYIRPTDVNDEAPAGTTAPLGHLGSGAGGVQNGDVEIMTDTSGQIAYRSSTNNAVYMATLGWRDSLGREA